MTIKRVREAFAISDGDAHRVFTAGDLVDTEDSAYRGREHLFEDLDVAVGRKAEPQTSATHAAAVERATAEPGERREIRPWQPAPFGGAADDRAADADTDDEDDNAGDDDR